MQDASGIYLSPHDIGLIRSWTQGEAIAVNDWLRHGFTLDQPPEAKIASQLDAIIARNMIASPFTLYRGIGADFAALIRAKNPRRGTRFSDAGFLSATLSRTVARRFAAHDLGTRKGLVLSITGQQSVCGIAVAPWSAFPEEKEVILARDTMLEVIRYNVLDSLIETKVCYG
ncbi:MAG: ADP-ribosyltransferase [Sphingomonadaceae bacterium]